MKTLVTAIAGMAAFFLLVSPAGAQDAVDTHTIIRSNSRLVLVDSVVTDKKGNYIHDLTQKDFRVWEDNKEQAISTFSFEAGGADPSNTRKHYLVLFFDNSTSSASNQVYARQAATKFIESNAGPNRLMAVVEYGGSLRVTQNFTDDADRLKKVVSGIKFSSVDPAGTGPGSSVGFTNFSVRSVLGALRNMAKGLADVPGRKTLVFLSAGFPMTDEVLSEVTATIDACNRANVAIYPIDVRGLATMDMGPGRIGMLGPGLPGLSLLQATLLSGPLAFQTRGAPAGGGSTGGASSGGAASGGSRAPSAPSTGGSTGSTSAGNSGTRGGVAAPSTGTNPSSGGRTGVATGNNLGNNNFGGGGIQNQNQELNNMRQRAIMPPNLDRTVPAAQAVLYALANGTGGFVIVNTNDLLGGLQKIGKEQNEYYILGYTPSKEFEPGSCHTLKVKVDRGGTEVRSRTGYCDAKTVDVLAGTPTERDLEGRLTANATPTITAASIQTPFFYIAANTVRVSAALEIPPGSLKFAKDKGKLRSTMNVVGIAYLPDGGIGARFSDSVKIVFDDKKQVEEFDKKPFHYEKQFEMASGKYNLKVVFSSSADSFGKLEVPLVMEPWSTDQFFLSALALSKDVRPATSLVAGIEAELIDNLTPLVVSGVQVTPTGTNHFRKTDKGFVYAEVYEPALTTPELKEAPAMGLAIQILDSKSGAVKKDLGGVRIPAPPLNGNPAVPVGLRLPINELETGSYRLQVTALDAAGHQVTRMAGFDVE